MSYIEITQTNFEELVLKAEGPVMVDFWASWCGPCMMLSPIVDEIAEEKDGLTVGKVNVDEEMPLAVQFGITSIPTLLVMKGGQVAAKAIGYRPKADILPLLDA